MPVLPDCPRPVRRPAADTHVVPPGASPDKTARAAWQDEARLEPSGRQARRLDNFDAATEMDHRLRRLSAVLWTVAILLCLLVTNTPAGQDYNRLAINLFAVPAAILAVIVVWRFPWQRHDRNLFIITTAAALVLMPLVVAWSGGWQSPFTPYYFFIVVFAALYYRRRLALLLTLVVMLEFAAPLLFGFGLPVGGRSLPVLLLTHGITYLSITLVGGAMADELMRLYSEALERLRARLWAEAALQRANDELEHRVAERTVALSSANERLRHELIERERAEAALRESEARYRVVFDSASIGMANADAGGQFLHANQAYKTLLGYTEDELRARTISDITHPEDVAESLRLHRELMAGHRDHYQLEKRYVRGDGAIVWAHLTVAVVRDAEERGRYSVAMVEDITARKALEERLAHQAFHDPLTGLPNRALFINRLEHALARAARRAEAVTVLFLDLDRFKVINDSLGHEAGDQLLVAVAARLLGCLRTEDTVARLGGDEFTILLETLDDSRDALAVAQRIIEALQAPVTLGEHEVFVTTSIGIARGNGGATSPSALLRDADTALYHAKQAGKARCAVFDPSMNTAAMERLALETDLRHAVERGEFELHYQPKVELATGRLSGLEALARWWHPRRGLISPGEFIPLAEETGLIVPLGRWVLTEACRQVRLWQELALGGQPLTLSVNLSAREFLQPDLVDEVARILDESRLAPGSLKLEITETVLMAEPLFSNGTLQALKRLGIQLVVDDFGTGYSSLGYLKGLPVDMLKIDRTFVARLGLNVGDTAIVEAVITLARALGLAVTAEGVERAEQLSRLRDLGCQFGQGYYFASPLSSTAMDALLARLARRWAPNSGAVTIDSPIVGDDEGAHDTGQIYPTPWFEHDEVEGQAETPDGRLALPARSETTSRVTASLGAARN